MEKEKLRIGVLFSRTGHMAVTEQAHIQGILLACDEINRAGGVCGRVLDPIFTYLDLWYPSCIDNRNQFSVSRGDAEATGQIT